MPGKLIEQRGRARVLCEALTPAWRAARKEWITSTDVPAMYDSEWKTTDDVIAAKLGMREVEQNNYMWWGTEMERPNGLAYAKIIGAEVELCNYMYVRKDGLPLSCTVDGFTRLDPNAEPVLFPWTNEANRNAFLAKLREKGEEWGLLELKNTSGFSRKKWRDGSPNDYWVQCQMAMHVTGLTWTGLVTKLGSADMMGYVVDYDKNFCIQAEPKIRALHRTVMAAKKFERNG